MLIDRARRQTFEEASSLATRRSAYDEARRLTDVPEIPTGEYVHDGHGNWHTLFDTCCGIVGGAALTPGVDAFGAPAEVGCAGYGLYKAVETIVSFSVSPSSIAGRRCPTRPVGPGLAMG
jgi:hypothetical protein